MNAKTSRKRWTNSKENRAEHDGLKKKGEIFKPVSDLVVSLDESVILIHRFSWVIFNFYLECVFTWFVNPKKLSRFRLGFRVSDSICLVDFFNYHIINMMRTMSQNLICMSPSPLLHQRKNPICSLSFNKDMTGVRATNIWAPLVLVARNMGKTGKTRSSCFPRADPNFVPYSRIAGTADSASATASILMRAPEYVSAHAREDPPTYASFLPRARPSLYPVYHPVNVTPACFAVDEFNKETNAQLHLVRVVAALEQLTGGYFSQLLTLEVLDEGVAKIFEAVVQTKSGSNDLRLVNFLEMEDSTIASTAAYVTGSTLMRDPVSALATEYPPTYGVSPPPPRPSPYSVGHPVNTAPAHFAVDEFNKETDAKLHLVRVVVALEVVDEGMAKIYDADVKTKFGSSSMRLVSFQEDSTIASTAASDTGSTLITDPDYMLARAIKKLPTYGFILPRPRPSPYPVDHHLIMAPARFAVDEINKKMNAKLHLVRVVSAFDRHTFDYFIQQLRLEVLDEGVAKIYSAEVRRKSGSSNMRLVVFFEVGNPS